MSGSRCCAETSAKLQEAQERIAKLEEELAALKKPVCTHPEWSKGVQPHCLSCGYEEPY